jgi:hypothetical protein
MFELQAREVLKVARRCLKRPFWQQVDPSVATHDESRPLLQKTHKYLTALNVSSSQSESASIQSEG